MSFTPDGSGIIITAGRFLRRWDLATDTLVIQWHILSTDCDHLMFSHDGSVFIVACNLAHGTGPPRVQLLHSDTLTEKTALVGNPGRVTCLNFSPDSRFLALGGSQGIVRIWNLKERSRSVAWRVGASVEAVSFSPDGTVAAVAAGEKLTLHDTDTQQQCGELAGHTGVVRAVCFSPNGTLLSAGDDGVVRLWDVAARHERVVLDWKIGPIAAAAFSRYGLTAAIGGSKGLVVWDTE
ncbi:MAG: hypothetical protein U0792_05520 [Gemmataceae bacterium]